jgi:hypothetical protein
MLLENRVLWGAIASLENCDTRLPTVLDDAPDIEVRGRHRERLGHHINALTCQLTTSVQYTQDAGLLSVCAASSPKGSYSFEFLSASLQTSGQLYFCFFVPFRRMLGGVLKRIARGLNGKGCQWHRLKIMATVESFRAQAYSRRGQVQISSDLCGLDLHVLAGHEQEIIFIGMNPAQSRVYEAVRDETKAFTLTPISATFCVGSSGSAALKDDGCSYFTVDRDGVINVSVSSSIRYLNDLVTLLSDFEGLQTLEGFVGRPVYRSRNAHKAAILASISGQG